MTSHDMQSIDDLSSVAADNDFNTNNNSNSHLPGRKRRLSPRRDVASYHRKRAITACQLCRTRKIKCDNQRPTCSTCKNAGEVCSFSSVAPVDLSSLDRGSITILERLELLAAVVNFNTTQLSQIVNVTAPNAHLNIAQSTTANDNHPGVTPPQPEEHSNLRDNANIRNTIVDAPRTTPRDGFLAVSAPLNPGRILSWPILDAPTAGQELLSKPFTHYAHCADRDSYGLSRPPADRNGSLANEENVVMLVEKYISNIHTKHPFVDSHRLRREARRVKEHGAAMNGWDCTVLLASSLGALSADFHDHRIFVQSPFRYGHVTSPSFERSDHALQQLQRSAAFYDLGCKWLSLLQPGWLSIQCLLLAAMYHMHRLQPVEAWAFISQACQRFWLYTRGDNAPLDFVAQAASNDGSYQRQLYWFCFKAESELRVYLEVPETGITNLHPNEHFPPLPREVSHLPPDAVAIEQEQNWYYVLTDISLRKLGNNILNTFYLRPLPLAEIISASDEFSQQLDGVQNLFPSSIHQIQDELKYVVRTRILLLRCSLFLTFVERVVHSSMSAPLPEGDTTASLPTSPASLPTQRSLLREKLESFISCTFGLLEEFKNCNRSYGLWIFGQACTTYSMASLAIFAASDTIRSRRSLPLSNGPGTSPTSHSLEVSLRARENLLEELVPQDWVLRLHEFIDALRRWAPESPELSHNADLLENLVEKYRVVASV